LFHAGENPKVTILRIRGNQKSDPCGCYNANAPAFAMKCVTGVVLFVQMSDDGQWHHSCALPLEAANSDLERV